MARSTQALSVAAVSAALACATAGIAPSTAATPTETATTATTATAPNSTRPNIVFVLADDLGWGDVHTPLTTKGSGNPYNETPTIDRLASQGVAFDNAYTAVNCVPTRAMLLTGLYAPRPTNNLYIVGDLNRGGDNTLLQGPPQGLPNGDDALPPNAYTVGDALQGAGYATGYFGKFHVTATADEITKDFGFGENWGGSSAGNASDYHAINGQFNDSIGPALDAYAAPYTQAYVDQNIKPYSHGVPDATLNALVGTPKHVTDAIADAAIDYIDRHDDQPFFTWVSDYAVHAPIGDKQARADLLAKYQAKAPIPGHPALPGYSALVEGLDQGLDRVVTHLETTPDPRNPGHPLADNTIVIFTSDNGGTANADNGLLSGYKGELREGGIRVPAIAWSQNPALVDGGGIVNHTPIIAVDYLRSFAALAHAPLPTDVPFDGEDISGLWSNANTELGDRNLYWHLPGYLIDDTRDQRPQSVIRSGPWKAVYSYETQDWDLFNLDTDIGEKHDVSADHPDITYRLGSSLIRWLNKVHAPLATLRTGSDPITVTFEGTEYANDHITHYDTPTQLTFNPGEEVPILLPASTQ